VLSILVGAIVAINQSDIKRVLAYSAVAHAGFALVPLVGAVTIQSGLVPGQAGSVASVMFYLVAYGFATLGCFALVTLVRTQGHETADLAHWAGLAKRYPWLGWTMVVLMASLAGIPLTAGFVGKFVAFAAAWRGGYAWLAAVAVAGSLVAVYLYFRVIQIMFFAEPDPAVVVEVARPGPATWVVLIVALLGTLGFAVVPGPLLDLFQATAGFLIPAGG
jgi:NADH-quinone oxidoreductase subunit N